MLPLYMDMEKNRRALRISFASYDQCCTAPPSFVSFLKVKGALVLNAPSRTWL